MTSTPTACVDALSGRPRGARAVLLALLLALCGDPTFAGIPTWQELPQDMAVTGPSARSWALSLADPFVMDDNDLGYRLAGDQHDLRYRTNLVATLRNVWGVRGRDDLLRALDDLLARGVHAEFDELVERQRERPDSRGWPQRAVARLLYPREEHRIGIVTSQASRIGPGGILAYDISRYVNLARRGYAVGYLSGSETWILVMAAARLAQSQFDSWDAYGRSFLAGRDFWGGATKDSRESFERAVHELLTRADGPWHLQPWRQSLEGTPVRAADPIIGDLMGAQSAAPERPLDRAEWLALAPEGPAAMAAAALIGGRTDELDGLVHDTASGDGRDAAGVWRRSQIYAGIAAVFPDQLDHPLWPVLDRTITDWSTKHGASHAAALVRAQYWISHAWASRGVGYPTPPTREQELAFLADLQRATQVLDGHERLHRSVAGDEPHWAVLRVRLANLSGLDKPAIHQMGLAALRRHPDYDAIAAETALALNPVWGGTKADAQMFLEEALALARPHGGEQLRARVALHLSRNAGMLPALLLAKAGFTWEAVKPAADEILARYPDPYGVNVTRMLGCISDLPERALPYLERVRGRIEPVAWFDDPWYVGHCARSAGVALGGPSPWVETAPPEVAAAPPDDSERLAPTVAAASVGTLLLLWFFVRQRRPMSAPPGRH